MADLLIYVIILFTKLRECCPDKHIFAKLAVDETGQSYKNMYASITFGIASKWQIVEKKSVMLSKVFGLLYRWTGRCYSVGALQHQSGYLRTLFSKLWLRWKNVILIGRWFSTRQLRNHICRGSSQIVRDAAIGGAIDSIQWIEEPSSKQLVFDEPS